VKSNRLSIKIIKPAADVFSFTTNPQNTPKWISSIVVGQVSEWPVGVGSTYRNQDKKGNWSEYVVTAFQENSLFELSSADGRYHVRYTYKPLEDYKSELEYFEWVDDGDLAAPLKLENLGKLKRLTEGV